MHKEKARSKENNFLYIIGIIVFIFVVAGLIEGFSGGQYILISDLILFFLMVFFVYLIIRYMVIEIEYTIIEDVLTFEKKLGKKSKKILSINATQIVYIIEKDHFKKKNVRFKEKYNLNGSLFGRKKYVILFNKDGNKSICIFQPSDILLTKIKDKKIDYLES